MSGPGVPTPEEQELGQSILERLLDDEERLARFWLPVVEIIWKMGAAPRYTEGVGQAFAGALRDSMDLRAPKVFIRHMPSPFPE